MASKSSGAMYFLSFVGSKLKSKRARLILCIIICYLAIRSLKRLYKRHYDKVEYVSLAEVLSSGKKYDFIVVGAGTAGSCVAGLVARDGRRPKVLLIEAGAKDDYHPLSSQVIPAFTQQNQRTSTDWNYETVPQQKGCDSLKCKRSYWPRGKVCGGSSILNYMVWVRGNPEDYNEWADVHECTGWSWE